MPAPSTYISPNVIRGGAGASLQEGRLYPLEE